MNCKLRFSCSKTDRTTCCISGIKRIWVINYTNYQNSPTRSTNELVDQKYKFQRSEVAKITVIQLFGGLKQTSLKMVRISVQTFYDTFSENEQSTLCFVRKKTKDKQWLWTANRFLTLRLNHLVHLALPKYIFHESSSHFTYGIL